MATAGANIVVVGVALTILLAGAVLLIVGLRGRIVGQDPHCRRCGFNLRGRDPASPKCPECGMVLTESSIRIGLRQRRATVLSIGLGLLIIAAAPLAWSGWEFARTYDWTPWKPTSWLVADLDAGDRAVRQTSTRELLKRVQKQSLSQAKLDGLIDKLLNRQGDQTKTWDRELGRIIESAAQSERVDAARLERYLEQGVTATLTLKPKLRRGRSRVVDLDLKFDRFGPSNRIEGAWETTAVVVNGAQLVERRWAHSEKREPLANSIGYSAGVGDHGWKNLASVPDGKYLAQSSVKAAFSMIDPIAIGPVTVEVPMTTPVELVPQDATVDLFRVDASRRQAMRSAVAAARVRRDSTGQLEVNLKFGSLPIALAAEVVLVQGAAEQRIGLIRQDVGRPPRWARVHARQKPRFSGAVDLHLRPAQAAADGTVTLNTYWGEPIVIRGVVVDAPYVPPLNRDESLRGAVQKSLSDCRVVRLPGGGLRVTLRARNAPIKLAYTTVLSRGGKEYLVDSCWTASRGNTSTSTLVCDDPAPGVDPEECDLVFRPSPDWEVHSIDDVPPWGGEIALRGVRIEPAPAEPSAAPAASP